MKKFYTNITKLNTSIILLIALIFSSFSCSKQANQALTLKSPDEKIAMDFKLCKIHSPLYSVKFNNQEIISTSSLGLDIKNQIIKASDHHSQLAQKYHQNKDSLRNDKIHTISLPGG